jgi:hypothetical protein
MKTLILIISCLGLALVIGPPILYLADAIDKQAMQSLMLAGTAVWFVSAPFWMSIKS